MHTVSVKPMIGKCRSQKGKKVFETAKVSLGQFLSSSASGKGLFLGDRRIKRLEVITFRRTCRAKMNKFGVEALNQGKFSEPGKVKSSRGLKKGVINNFFFLTSNGCFYTT